MSQRLDGGTRLPGGATYPALHQTATARSGDIGSSGPHPTPAPPRCSSAQTPCNVRKLDDGPHLGTVQTMDGQRHHRRNTSNRRYPLAGRPQTSYPIEGSRLPKLGATNISVTVTIRRATPNAATSRLARLLDVPERRSDRTDPSVGDAAAEGSDRALGDSAGSAAHRHLWGDSSAGADGECVSR